MKTIMKLYTIKDRFGNINIWYHICRTQIEGWSLIDGRFPDRGSIPHRGPILTEPSRDEGRFTVGRKYFSDPSVYVGLDKIRSISPYGCVICCAALQHSFISKVQSAELLPESDNNSTSNFFKTYSNTQHWIICQIYCCLNKQAQSIGIDG